MLWSVIKGPTCTEIKLALYYNFRFMNQQSTKLVRKGNMFWCNFHICYKNSLIIQCFSSMIDWWNDFFPRKSLLLKTVHFPVSKFKSLVKRLVWTLWISIFKIHSWFQSMEHIFQVEHLCFVKTGSHCTQLMRSKLNHKNQN